PGPQNIITLFLKARRKGRAVLQFAPPATRSEPVFLMRKDQDLREVAGIRFVGGLTVNVQEPAVPAHKLAVSPSSLEFGFETREPPSLKLLRLSNLGSSDLLVPSITTTIPDFFKTDFTSPFEIPALSFAELPVRFCPKRVG